MGYRHPPPEAFSNGLRISAKSGDMWRFALLGRHRLMCMIIRSVREIVGTARDVHGDGWKSRRLVLSDEDIGYSVHETTLEAGVSLSFEYQHHRETVYCVSGEGQVEDLASGRTASLAPGGLYSAGIGEPHRITTSTEMRLLCIFTPPLAGIEEAD